MKKIDNLDFDVATTPFTLEKSGLLGVEEVFDGYKKKKEVVSDLFFELVPPISDSCNRSRVYLTLKEVENQYLKKKLNSTCFQL